MKEDRDIMRNWFSVFPLGHEAPGVKHWLDETEKSFGCHNDLGEEDVIYDINECQYRGKTPPMPYQDAAFGCSYTLGQGVDVPWPAILEVANCGVNGASNDKIARMVITYCKLYAPKTVYVMWTFPERREYIEEDGSIHKFRRPNPKDIPRILSEPTPEGAHLLLMNDQADKYNLEKNKILVESYCKAQNIELKQIDYNTYDKTLYSLGRDGDHPGPDWHATVAAHFLL
jgi:hypothetical protein